MWDAEEIKRLLVALETIARQQKIANLIAIGDFSSAMRLMDS